MNHEVAREVFYFLQWTLLTEKDNILKFNTRKQISKDYKYFSNLFYDNKIDKHIINEILNYIENINNNCSLINKHYINRYSEKLRKNVNN